VTSSHAHGSRYSSTPKAAGTIDADLAAEITRAKAAEASLDARLKKLEAPVSPPTTYLFSDDFTGTSLDTTKWRVSNHGVDGGGRACCGDQGANFADAVSVSGGYLHLAANLVNGVWHRGCIDTETKYLAGFGIWEARIKCPAGKGLWPAFWGYNSTTGEELDALEGGNAGALAMQGVHRFDNSPRDPAVNTPMSLSDDFHVYGVEYRATGIQFSIDGVKRGALAPPLAKGSTMPLILNLGVGNASWSAIGEPDATTPATNEMLVDFVRISA
jgi:beta-glucanase (GH16 family)